MKIIISLIAVALVSSAVTFVAMSGKKAIDTDHKTEAKEEQASDVIAKLRRDNQMLKAREPKVEIIERSLPRTM